MNTVTLPHPNTFLIVEPLDYPNPYDFKTPHRHDYFEIILIKEGGGEQLIDFTRTELTKNTIYTIYPRQIHLLKRTSAKGLIVQFRKDIFEFIFPVQHQYLYFAQADLHLSPEDFQNLYTITEQIHLLYQQPKQSPLSFYKSYSYLQILLITLIELQQQRSIHTSGSFAGEFLQLLGQHIKEYRKVSEYAELMHLSSDKFTTLCKETLGATPLKLIHEELLLEIKRQMILDKLSLKEIAYELNFDNTANFSNFIKTATGITPTELQEQLKNTLH